MSVAAMRQHSPWHLRSLGQSVSILLSGKKPEITPSSPFPDRAEVAETRRDF